MSQICFPFVTNLKIFIIKMNDIRISLTVFQHIMCLLFEIVINEMTNSLVLL